MTNQVLSPPGATGPKLHRDRDVAVGILVAFVVLGLLVVTAIILRDEPVLTSPVTRVKGDEQPFSTQQYWDKAAEYELSKRAAVAAAVEPPTTYTQQYWDKAAEYEWSKSAAGALFSKEPATYTQQSWDMAAFYELSKRAAGAMAVEQPATFTQQYWDKAAEYELSKRAAGAAAAEQPFSTQQYWDKATEYELSKRAAESPPAAQEVEPEWAYYTERYWSRTR